MTVPPHRRGHLLQELGFTVDGAFHFQYSYESDGKTFTASATGDIGCTGKPATTTLTGRVGQDCAWAAKNRRLGA